MDHAKGIAGVDYHFSDIGASAVSLVVGELNTNQYGIPEIRRSISVESVWKDGAHPPPSPSSLQHLPRTINRGGSLLKCAPVGGNRLVA